MTALDSRPSAPVEAREPRWVRPFVIAAAALVLLLVGATGGLLIGRAGVPEVPAAESVDVGFLQDMSVHHQQAVEMATWEQEHTSDPELRQLAYDIQSTQTGQIGRMQGWLELWGASSQPVGREYMTWMAGSPTGAHEHTVTASGVATMPGMASADDLKRLRGVHRQGPRRAVPAADAPPPPGRRRDAELRGDERVAGAGAQPGRADALARRPRRRATSRSCSPPAAAPRCRYRRTVPSALTVQPGLWATSQT